MEKLVDELREFSAETRRELWRWMFPALALSLYFATSFILNHCYHEEDGGDTDENTRSAHTHAFLGTYGTCTLFIFAVSGILGGWWLTLVDPVFWVASLALYALGAFAFWMCTIAEPNALDRLARTLSLPAVEN